MRLPLPPPARRLSITSMIDVAFLMIVFFMVLPMRQLDGKLAAHLPKEHG